MGAAERSEFSIDVERRESGALVRLRGHASMEHSDELRQKLLSLASPTCRQLVLDLAELEFINSVGLGALVAAHLRCRNLGGAMKIASPSSAVRELLDVTKLKSLFQVYPSVAAAFESTVPVSRGS